MAHTKSAKKRHRQSLERRAKNRSTKAALKNQMRRIRELATAGNTAEGDKEANSLTKRLDQAAAKGIIHRGKAARLKSRAAHRLKTAKGKTTAKASA